MDKNALRELVARDLQGRASTEEVSPLRSRTNISAWYEELVIRKKELDTQFTNRKARLGEMHSMFRFQGWQTDSQVRYKQAEIRYNEWRTQAMILRASIEARLAEARDIKKQYLKANKDKDNQKSPALVDLLKRAAKLIPRTGDGAIWHDDLERAFW